MEASEPTPGIGHNKPPLEEVLKDQYGDLFAEVAKLAEEATKAKNALGDPCKVTSDEQRDPLIRIGLEAKKLAKRVDETRLEHTKPARDEIDQTNKIFNSQKARPDMIVSVFERLVGEYDCGQREAERRRLAQEARRAQEEAQRKLEEAAAAEHSIVGDVVLEEAAEAHQRSLEAEAKVQLATKGPTRTEVGTVSHSAPWAWRYSGKPTDVDLNRLRTEIGIDVIEKAIAKHVRANKGSTDLPGVEAFQETRTTFRG